MPHDTRITDTVLLSGHQPCRKKKVIVSWFIGLLTTFHTTFLYHYVLTFYNFSAEDLVPRTWPGTVLWPAVWRVVVIVVFNLTKFHCHLQENSTRIICHYPLKYPSLFLFLFFLFLFCLFRFCLKAVGSVEMISSIEMLSRLPSIIQYSQF